MSIDEGEKAQILSRIERLQKLLADLEHVSATALERAKIRDRMRQELEAARNSRPQPQHARSRRMTFTVSGASRRKSASGDSQYRGMRVVTLTCPYCGSSDIQPMPNTELRTKIIVTPYHCAGCQRTFESGPFQVAQKAHPSDPKPKRDGD